MRTTAAAAVLLATLVLTACSDDTTTELRTPSASEDEATTTTVQGTTTTEAPKVGSRQNPAPVGSVYAVSSTDSDTDKPVRWELSILPGTLDEDAWPEVKAENQFNDPPAPGKRFVMVKVRAKYLGDADAQSLNWEFNALDEGGVKYTPYEDSCGVIPNELEDSRELFPGGTLEGNVCWAVNEAHLASLVVLLEPAFAFDNDNDVYMALR